MSVSAIEAVDADYIVGVSLRDGAEVHTHAVIKRPDRPPSYYCRPEEASGTVDFTLEVAVTCDDCKAKLQIDLWVGGVPK